MNYLKGSAKLLKKNKLSISTAESLTGGMLASNLVSISGISKCFNYGFITYSNEAKELILGVRKSTIDNFGVVSHETAREMAKFVRDKANSDIGLATTGIAGPLGGTKDNPVGTVYISCAISGVVITRKYIFKGNRQSIREQAVNSAFKLLHDSIKKYIV